MKCTQSQSWPVLANLASPASLCNTPRIVPGAAPSCQKYRGSTLLDWCAPRQRCRYRSSPAVVRAHDAVIVLPSPKMLSPKMQAVLASRCRSWHVALLPVFSPSSGNSTTQACCMTKQLKSLNWVVMPPAVVRSAHHEVSLNTPPAMAADPRWNHHCCSRGFDCVQLGGVAHCVICGLWRAARGEWQLPHQNRYHCCQHYHQLACDCHLETPRNCRWFERAQAGFAKVPPAVMLSAAYVRVMWLLLRLMFSHWLPDSAMLNPVKPVPCPLPLLGLQWARSSLIHKPAVLDGTCAFPTEAPLHVVALAASALAPHVLPVAGA
mmetsp:Transcript_41434/g.81931  ORF Transcript_41434/g.81931 Transcript_41434/m.81931 type:complete len:321 (-) Transcript_41434:546-1508(-)